MDPAVQTFIDAIPETHRPLFDRLHSLIFELYPDAQVVILYRIPTYRVGLRRVYLGLWKEGVSLHAVDKALIEEFKQWHPAIKTGKGSLNFRLTDKLPEVDIRDTIRRALDET